MIADDEEKLTIAPQRRRSADGDTWPWDSAQLINESEAIRDKSEDTA